MTSRRPISAEDSVRTLPLALGLVAFAVLGFAGNRIGAALRYPEIGAAVFFPPYAVLTAALMLSRARHWIWYFVVGSIIHFVTHWPLWSPTWVILADIANVARAVSAALLLRWRFRGLPRLDSVPALLTFSAIAGLIAPAIGATIGAADVVVHDPAATYARPWMAWFVSNAMTGLVMLPAAIALLEWLAGRHAQLLRERPREVMALLICLGVTCLVAFGRGSSRLELALAVSAPMPALIWAALRFGAGFASLAVTTVSLAVLWSIDRGAGPFLAPSPDETIVALQIFLFFTATSTLCLSAIATGRRHVVQLYETLLASLHDHVAILDARGVVLQANHSWRRFAASTPAPAPNHVSDGESYVDACRALAGRGDAQFARLLAGVTAVLARDRRRFEAEYDVDRDGQRQSFAVTVEALERPDGGAVVTRADITARRLAQIELEQQRRELAHLSRVAVLGQLSGAFAHELSQPLAAILSNAEAGRHLLQREPLQTDELRAILGDISADDRRAASVIQRLRALFAKADWHVEPLDADQLVDETLQIVQSELVARHVHATRVVDPDLPRFPGDKVQLQQVLLNLILNGCEAMMATPQADRQLVVSANASRSGYVQLAVRDAGTGIAPAILDQLFEPFVTTKPDGLGLGLSIARTIVAAHGGRLWAEANPTGGTTMRCLLPA